MKRFTFLVLLVLCVLAVFSCGDDTEYYVANGCYCLEGYRLAKGEGKLAEAVKACSSMPDEGYVKVAFDKFNNDKDLELYYGPRETFTDDNIKLYLSSGYRMSMQYPVPVKCGSLTGCYHIAPVYKFSDIRPDTKWLFVAGKFNGGAM